MARKTSLEKVEAEIEAVEAELAKVRERQTILVKKWQGLKGRELTRTMKALFPDEEFHLEGIFKVDWNALGNGGYGQKWWDKITGWLDVQQHGVYNPETAQNEGPAPLRGVYRDGHNPETNQVAFTLMLRKGEPLDDQMGIKLILPYMTPVDGWRSLRIFRHDLSAHGSWAIRVSEDGENAEVWNNRHLRYADDDRGLYKAEFTGTLDDALAYCQDHHYYE